MKTGFSKNTLPKSEKVLLFCALECFMEDMLENVHVIASHSNIPVITSELILSGLKFAILPPTSIANKINTILELAIIGQVENESNSNIGAAKPVFDKIVGIYNKHQIRFNESHTEAVTKSWQDGKQIDEHAEVTKPLVAQMLSDFFTPPIQQEEEEDEDEDEVKSTSAFITCTCELCSKFVLYSKITVFPKGDVKSPFALAVLGTLEKLQKTYA